MMVAAEAEIIQNEEMASGDAPVNDTNVPRGAEEAPSLEPLDELDFDNGVFAATIISVSP
jgi:hypothetical protein